MNAPIQSLLFETPAARQLPELAGGPDFLSYDYWVLATSGGKDSQTILYEASKLADRIGFPRERIVAVHADLGRVEWQGTLELARAQAEALGFRFVVVRKGGADLLDRVLERYEKYPEVVSWFRPDARWCTSDFKRGPIQSVFTKLVRELRPRGHEGNLSVECPECFSDAWIPCEGERGTMKGTHRERKDAAQARPPVRILNGIGLRAAESTARSKLDPFKHDSQASNKLRHVDVWLPIFAWSAEAVWASIEASGLPSHRAYKLGMPRLSCAFCIYSTEPGLMLAGEHNRELLATYVEIEKKTGHSFKRNLPLARIAERLDAGERQTEPVTSWEDCGA